MERGARWVWVRVGVGFGLQHEVLSRVASQQQRQRRPLIRSLAAQRAPPLRRRRHAALRAAFFGCMRARDASGVKGWLGELLPRPL